MSKTTCIKIFSDCEHNQSQLKTNVFWRLVLSPFIDIMNMDDGDRGYLWNIGFCLNHDVVQKTFCAFIHCESLKTFTTEFCITFLVGTEIHNKIFIIVSSVVWKLKDNWKVVFISFSFWLTEIEYAVFLLLLKYIFSFLISVTLFFIWKWFLNLAVKIYCSY